MQPIIHISQFEGPFDVLLHFVKQAKVEISQLPLAEITQQYLEFINQMQELNLEIASEYLVVAAQLIEIKARALLPKPVPPLVEDEIDPKEALIARLIEYQKYKEMSEILAEYEIDHQHYFFKDASDASEWLVDTEPRLVQEQYDLFALVKAFERAMQKQEQQNQVVIHHERYSIDDQVRIIRKQLRQQPVLAFTDLFTTYSRSYMVTTFLAILQMMRDDEIALSQTQNFGEIIINWKRFVS
ncbi:MAG: segregation and condensation protein A [Culicoidibacterales bacterium]